MELVAVPHLGGEVAADLCARVVSGVRGTVVFPDLAFYEGQAVAAAVALEYLAVDSASVSKVLANELVEQQGARRSREYLAGFAKVLARVNQHEPG